MGWKIKDTSNISGLYRWSLYYKGEWCASSSNRCTLSNIVKSNNKQK